MMHKNTMLVIISPLFCSYPLTLPSKTHTADK